MKKIDSNQDLLHHMAGFAQTLFPVTGEVIPMWIMQNAEGVLQPVITPFEDDDGKEAVAIAIKEAMKEYGAVRYGFMAEAWALEVDKNHPDFGHLKETARPSEHPDRREVIQLFVEDNQGHSLMGRLYILRPENGLAKLSPLKLDNEERVVKSGRFTGLLQKIH